MIGSGVLCDNNLSPVHHFSPDMNRMLMLMPRPGQSGTGGQAVRNLLVRDLEEAGCTLAFLDPEDGRFHGLGRSFPGRLWQRFRFYVEVVRMARRHRATDVVFDLYHFQRLWPVPWLLKVTRPGCRCHAIVQSPEKLVTGDEIERRFAPWFFVGDVRRLEWNRRLVRWAAKACHQVLAAGPWMQGFMVDTVAVPREKVRAFGPGNGLVSAPTTDETPEHVEDPAPIIGVGYVDPYKGVHRVIEALALVDDPAVRIDWLGDDRHHNPDYAAWCRQRVDELGLADRFRFRGRLNRSRMNGHYAAGRVLVSAAPYEGYGLNHLEALSHGLAILGPQGSSSELFIPREWTGRTYPLDHPDELASVMQECFRALEDTGPVSSSQILDKHLALPRLCTMIASAPCLTPYE